MPGSSWHLSRSATRPEQAEFLAALIDLKKHALNKAFKEAAVVVDEIGPLPVVKLFGLPGTANAHERERLLGMLMTLHEVAASVAQVDVANRLAELRASDEERRHSIRQSAVNTSMYDLTIQVATQRPLCIDWGFLRRGWRSSGTN